MKGTTNNAEPNSILGILLNRYNRHLVKHYRWSPLFVLVMLALLAGCSSDDGKSDSGGEPAEQLPSSSSVAAANNPSSSSSSGAVASSSSSGSAEAGTTDNSSSSNECELDACGANQSCNINMQALDRCGNTGKYYCNVSQYCEIDEEAGTYTVKEKEFCSDGAGWYNAETHFCQDIRGGCMDVGCYFSNPVVITALCGGKEYAYWQFCSGSEAFDLCGTGIGNRKTYDPATEGCCGSTLFSKSDQRCEADAIEAKCGQSWYNTETQYCKEGATPTEYGTETIGNATYKTVVIGEQTWVAENLRGGSRGISGYYTWSDAQTACPAGWHLPNDAEWTELINFAGSSLTAGAKLKAVSSWDSGNGTDDYGFAAKAEGRVFSYGAVYGMSYSGKGTNGYWWSATSNNREVTMGTGNGVSFSTYSGSDWGPGAVRCIKD